MQKIPLSHSLSPPPFHSQQTNKRVRKKIIVQIVPKKLDAARMADLFYNQDQLSSYQSPD